MRESPESVSLLNAGVTPGNISKSQAGFTPWLLTRWSDPCSEVSEC